MNSAQVGFLDLVRPRCWILALSWNELSSGRLFRLWTATLLNPGLILKWTQLHVVSRGHTIHVVSSDFPWELNVNETKLFQFPSCRRCLLSKSGWSTLSALHFPWERSVSLLLFGVDLFHFQASRRCLLLKNIYIIYSNYIQYSIYIQIQLFTYPENET